MRVLICGGGVAGTVAGLAARKAGFAPTIYEAYGQSAGLAHGVYLTVAVNGIDALRAVDAAHVVTGPGFPSREIEFSNGDGRRLGVVSLGPELADGTVTHTVRRADLYAGLLDEAARRGVPVEHGKRLVSAEMSNKTVVAHFADGSSVEGDVLVGADGVWSTTRTLIDPGNPAPRYAGLGNTGGFTRAIDPAVIGARPGDYRMIWGRRCFFGVTVSPDGEIWWFANPPSRTEIPRAELRALTADTIRNRLLTLLDGEKTAQIVRATTNMVLTQQYDLPTVRTWQNGSMVIIGDAAHAVSPASGQGCSLAAEDAVVLIKCLRDRPTVAQALATYESLRRNRVEKIVRWGASMNTTKREGLLARLVRDYALPLILRKANTPKQTARMGWLFEHQVNWHQPVKR